MRGCPTQIARHHLGQVMHDLVDYPILDVRALASLGHRGRSVYPVSFWIRYLEACRRLAAEHYVSIRELDKALWQWSKENGDG